VKESPVEREEPSDPGLEKPEEAVKPVTEEIETDDAICSDAEEFTEEELNPSVRQSLNRLFRCFAHATYRRSLSSRLILFPLKYYSYNLIERVSIPCRCRKGNCSRCSCIVPGIHCSSSCKCVVDQFCTNTTVRNAFLDHIPEEEIADPQLIAQLMALTDQMNLNQQAQTQAQQQLHHDMVWMS